MDDFKEFEGKNIDEAIDEACDYFGVEREKLEIDIVNEAKGGIFGLMGGRKALIKARMFDNSPQLTEVVADVVTRLLSPIIGVPDMDIEIESPDKVKVTVRDEEHPGLLIGREGQTLAALQYLANRIMAKRWPDPVRVRIDTGDYRERQDDHLRQIAVHLADKVKTHGRPQSTKPLSSYHRRVVHLTLQDDPDVLTRSKGEGPLKRVLILPKRAKGKSEAAPDGDGEE